MQYISPLSLIESPGTDLADKKALLLAKKKMLAELEISGGSSVFINGKELTKNDIVNFFDNLQQKNDLYLHLLVAKDAVLLRFLEHNLLENSDRFLKTEVYADDTFIEWLSPYYYNSFTRFGFLCISELNDDAWATMFANPILMNDYYQEQAWDYFEKELAVDLGRLREGIQDKELFDETLVGLLCDIRYVHIMKKLPAERFGSFCDQYAAAIMGAAIVVFNRGWRNLDIIYMDSACQLATGRDMREETSKKQAEMDLIVRRGQKGPDQKVNWWVVRAICLALYFFLKMAACNNNHYSSDNLQNIPIYIDSQRYDGSISFDSFNKKIDSLRAAKSRAAAALAAPVTDSATVKHSKKARHKIKDTAAG